MRFGKILVGILVFTMVMAISITFSNVTATPSTEWEGGTTEPVTNTANTTENTTITPPEISQEQYIIAGFVFIMFIGLVVVVNVLRGT